MSCVKKVRETLTGITDVEKVDVDFKAKTATVTMKAGKSLTKDAVEKAFKGSAYGVSSFDKKKDDKKPGDAYAVGVSGMK